MFRIAIRIDSVVKILILDKMSQLFSRITPGRHRLPMNSKGILLYIYNIYIYTHIRVYLLYLGVISVCLGPTHVGDCWRAYTYWIQNASR